MNRIIVTGANGVGKSHFARQLASVRPDVPVISFDALKLRTGWQQRPRRETESALVQKLAHDRWILEGGPSLLGLAVERADALVWLDPPEWIRAWRLAIRPWKNLGKTRSELPAGNVDWPWQQYKFALRSLKNRSTFRRQIAEVFRTADGVQNWRCHSEDDRVAVIRAWGRMG